MGCSPGRPISHQTVSHQSKTVNPNGTKTTVTSTVDGTKMVNQRVKPSGVTVVSTTVQTNQSTADTVTKAFKNPTKSIK